jgi:hypothetical protein
MINKMNRIKNNKKINNKMTNNKSIKESGKLYNNHKKLLNFL